MVTAISFTVWPKAKQSVNNFHLPLLRLGSRLETITQAASTPVWTLTVMRTSTLFLIVSTGDSSFASVVLTLLFCAYLYGFHCFFWCFAAFRAQQGEVLRSTCRIVPLEAFRIGAEWLQYQITSPIDTGDNACKLSLTQYQRGNDCCFHTF